MQPESYGRSTVTSRRGQQGTLEQLPDGRWRARYRENGRAGKRPQRTFASRRDAADWLRGRLDEAVAVADGDVAVTVRRREAGRTVADANRDFLAAYDGGRARRDVIEKHLRILERLLGDRPIQQVEPYELRAARLTVSEGYRADVFKSWRQMFRQAKADHWIADDPTAAIVNKRRPRQEVEIFGWDEILAVGGEIELIFDGLPEFATATGLRPEELLGLERRDIDRAGRVVHVRRVWAFGRLVELGPDGAKSRRQRRDVPLRLVALEALDRRPHRIDTEVLFPGRDGRRISLDTFRHDYWAPALKAAGVKYRKPYAMRHTYAAESIAATIDLFTLSERMGTSLRQIDLTYGHLVRDSAERELELLDAYDRASGRLVDAR